MWDGSLLGVVTVAVTVAAGATGKSMTLALLRVPDARTGSYFHAWINCGFTSGWIMAKGCGPMIVAAWATRRSGRRGGGSSLACHHWGAARTTGKCLMKLIA
jgi:hypothetical protein